MADVLESSLAVPFRDEDGDIRAEFLALVEDAISSKNRDGLTDLVGDLHEADLADLLKSLHSDDRPLLIELMGTDFDFAALNELDETERVEILDELDTGTVVEGIKELDSDDAVSLLEGLDEEEQDEILERMPAVERAVIERALDYPEDSAGRLMQSEVIAVPPFWTVGQTIDHMRETEDLPNTFYEIYVVDAGHRLLGAVPLDRLLRNKRPVKIEEIVSEAHHSVKALDDQGDVARRFQRYNLASAAVVDEAGRLVGTLTVDDIVDVIDQEADANLKALGGVKGDEEISDSILTTTRSRFGWLFVNLITAFVAAAVVSLFEAQLEQMVALAVLAPIVASQGGNAATQTMTVAVRALATRDLMSANLYRVVTREAVVGLLNGVGFALLTGSVAALWFKEIGLGIVIGLAMIVNLLAGALGGILIPIALHRLKADPAVSSGVFVTTVTDVVGFFAFLGIASWWFGLIR